MKWIFASASLAIASCALAYFHADAPIQFAVACAAIVPLSALLGQATEALVHHVGPNIGALLNATFGNATEFIITLFALKAGELDVVRASITGSIIGNLLLVLGISALVGGVKYKSQTFSKTAAGSQSVMMIMATLGLYAASLFVLAERPAPNPDAVLHLGVGVCSVLLALYVMGLAFSLKTHSEIFAAVEISGDEPAWSRPAAAAILLVATALVALESELLVAALHPTLASFHMSAVFVGVVVLPIIGNASEHATAVRMALRNRMDVSLNISLSSSTQIALLVAPVLVLVSGPLGHPLPFVFSPPELIAVGFSTMIAGLVSRDGETNWLEGAQLLALYIILALAFFYITRAA